MNNIIKINTPIIPIGVKFMLLSALGFSFMSASVKYVAQHGIPIFEIVVARALISLIISYLDVKRKKISVWGNNKLLLISRGVVGTVALTCVYYVLTTVPLAEATILQYIYPVFTAFLSWLILKERILWSTKICIALSILGLFIMVQPGIDGKAEAAISPFSVVVAVLGALMSSIAYILVKKLSNTEDSSVIIFYFPLIALPVSLVLMGDNIVIPDLHLIIVLVMLGIFTQIGQYFLTKAMQSQDANKASAYGYVQILFSTILGVVIFGDLPSIWSYLGGGLIVLGALINVFGQKIKRF